MFCPKCGAPVTPGDKYCDKCGAPLLSEPQPEKKKKSSVLLAAVVAVELLVIAVVGGLLFVHFTRGNQEEADSSETVQTEAKDDKSESPDPTTPAKEVETPTPVPVTPTKPAEETSEEEEPSEEPAEETSKEISEEQPAQAKTKTTEAAVITELKKVDEIRESYQRLTTDKVVEATASSTIQQDEVSNPPINILDDDSMSNWQEGLEGDGIGEYTYFKFDQEYSMEALTLRLGNWKTERYFYGNNRPKTLKFEAGGQTFTTTFPDEWTEFAVKFSSPVTTDELKITLQEVYKGVELDDTVITDICFWYS